jgi:nucleosome binding factor SPN SPT16 subunit
VLVQSGDNFTLNKFSTECDDNKLTADVLYLNICSKYTDMHAMASRTLLINPTQNQKQAYMLAFDSQQHLIDSLKVGTPLSEVYNSTKKFIEEKNGKLVTHVNFGFGIGCSFKEELLAINASNSTKIEPGMVFHARITFKEVEKTQSKSIIAIGDTVLV